MNVGDCLEKNRGGCSQARTRTHTHTHAGTHPHTSECTHAHAHAGAHTHIQTDVTECTNARKYLTTRKRTHTCTNKQLSTIKAPRNPAMIWSEPSWVPFRDSREGGKARIGPRSNRKDSSAQKWGWKQSLLNPTSRSRGIPFLLRARTFAQILTQTWSIKLDYYWKKEIFRKKIKNINNAEKDKKISLYRFISNLRNKKTWMWCWDSVIDCLCMQWTLCLYPPEKVSLGQKGLSGSWANFRDQHAWEKNAYCMFEQLAHLGEVARTNLAWLGPRKKIIWGLLLLVHILSTFFTQPQPSRKIGNRQRLRLRQWYQSFWPLWIQPRTTNPKRGEYKPKCVFFCSMSCKLKKK